MQAQLFVMISHTGLSRNLWGGQTVTITITFLPSLPQIHFSLLPFPWLPYNHFANGSAFELISRYRHHQDHYEKLRPSKQHCPNWEQKGRSWGTGSRPQWRARGEGPAFTWGSLCVVLNKASNKNRLSVFLYLLSSLVIGTVMLKWRNSITKCNRAKTPHFIASPPPK